MDRAWMSFPQFCKHFNVMDRVCLFDSVWVRLVFKSEPHYVVQYHLEYKIIRVLIPLMTG